jgi:2',3'-cyclic-nucleotide 2'-phosphodiesterase (5'-nucleotidase family)
MSTSTPTTITPTARSTRVGLARTADLIAGIRAEATNAILLDNGDFLQGNPMGDYIAYSNAAWPRATAIR